MGRYPERGEANIDEGGPLQKQQPGCGVAFHFKTKICTAKNYFLRFCKTQITAQTAEIMPHRVLISRLGNLKYLLSALDIRTQLRLKMLLLGNSFLVIHQIRLKPKATV